MLYVDARSQSLKDELTQLPNRRFFIDTIREKSGHALGLMILDIDFFKKINDSWGHLVGDEVLFSLGKQLAKLTSEQVQPARIGGEELPLSSMACRSPSCTLWRRRSLLTPAPS